MLTLKSIPLAWQMGLQDAATPIMEELSQLHDHIMFFLTMIFTFVFTLFFHIIRRFTKRSIAHKYMTHGVLIEIIWTLTPALILLSIAFPSFQLLYLMDEVLDPAITIKAIGHQWYWSYEYSDYLTSGLNTFSFDSYMIPTEDLPTGGLRLLEVDNPIVLPINTHVRVIVTAADVLHSWTVPALGVKIDAVPGRLNQTSFILKREGSFYGQCSELCGLGHAFMPIIVKGVSLGEYLNWLKNSA